MRVSHRSPAGYKTCSANTCSASRVRLNSCSANACSARHVRPMHVRLISCSASWVHGACIRIMWWCSLTAQDVFGQYNVRPVVFGQSFGQYMFGQYMFGQSCSAHSCSANTCSATRVRLIHVRQYSFFSHLPYKTLLAELNWPNMYLTRKQALNKEKSTQQGNRHLCDVISR